MHVLSLFLPVLIEIRHGGFGILNAIIIGSFGLVFDLEPQICKNCHTQLFSMEYLAYLLSCKVLTYNYLPHVH